MKSYERFKFLCLGLQHLTSTEAGSALLHIYILPAPLGVSTLGNTGSVLKRVFCTFLQVATGKVAEDLGLRVFGHAGSCGGIRFTSKCSEINDLVEA